MSEAISASTPDRILRTAERMFARKGYRGVSLRSVIRESRVNAAAIHYHFGSKRAMLEEIFARRCGPMNARRLALLADCREGPDRPPLLEQILEAYLRPSLIWPEDPEGAHNFLRLRSALAHEDDGLNQDLIARHFNEVSRKFIDALAGALPDIPLEDIYWRVHFLHAAQYYTLLNPDRIRYLSNDVCDPSDMGSSLRYIVSFFAAAFRLPADSRMPVGWAFNDRKSVI